MDTVMLKPIIIKDNSLIRSDRNDVKFIKSDLTFYFHMSKLDGKITIYAIDLHNHISLKLSYPLKTGYEIDTMIDLYNYYSRASNVTIDELLNFGYEHVELNEIENII